MSLNPFALEWYPSPSSSPEGTSFIQQIAALDNLSLDDFYEVRIRIYRTRPGTSALLLLFTYNAAVIPQSCATSRCDGPRRCFRKVHQCVVELRQLADPYFRCNFRPNVVVAERRSECSFM
jgi:hypothetical protein